MGIHKKRQKDFRENQRIEKKEPFSEGMRKRDRKRKMGKKRRVQKKKSRKEKKIEQQKSKSQRAQ